MVQFKSPSRQVGRMDQILSFSNIQPPIIGSRSRRSVNTNFETIYLHICIFANMYTCIYMYICIYVYLHLCIYLQICIFAAICCYNSILVHRKWAIYAETWNEIILKLFTSEPYIYIYIYIYIMIVLKCEKWDIGILPHSSLNIHSGLCGAKAIIQQGWRGGIFVHSCSENSKYT